ncbi:MAG: hypothetical protein JWP46_2019 [Modestobacter sp.]|nr:hypothetical protein [Modestobacter sp.]
MGLNRPTRRCGTPTCHAGRGVPCWPEYLWPAGFGGSIGVGLFTAAGIVQVRSRSGPLRAAPI